jgi:hypothetical protein
MDEQEWGRAMQLAKTHGHDPHDYAYILGAFKAQNPERFSVRPLEKADMGVVRFVRTDARVAATARRVARRYAVGAGERVAYEEGKRGPDGLSWANGTVEDNEFHGEGSLFPPSRDGRGSSLEGYAKVPTNGLTTMLSKNKAPKTAVKSNVKTSGHREVRTHGGLVADWEYNSPRERVYSVRSSDNDSVVGELVWDKRSNAWLVYALDGDGKSKVGSFTSADDREGVKRALLVLSDALVK